jgi:hypothetical protein
MVVAAERRETAVGGRLRLRSLGRDAPCATGKFLFTAEDAEGKLKLHSRAALAETGGSIGRGKNDFNAKGAKDAK